MGIVMIKCPRTGYDISTGIVTDRASFNATPVFFARAYCPMCRAQHEWFAKEAWVCDGKPSDGEPRSEACDAPSCDAPICSAPLCDCEALAPA